MNMTEELSSKCKRCGACCVYFFIYEDRSGGLAELEPVFKQGWTACKYLEYDPENKKASCKIYNGRRPKTCESFDCGECDDRTLRDLKEMSGNIESYIGEQGLKTHQPSQI